MSSCGGLAGGLAFLPNWLNGGTEPGALDAALAGCVRSFGWRAAGLIWPAGALPVVLAQAAANNIEQAAPVAAESDGVLTALRDAETTLAVGSDRRLFARITPPGRSAGVVWADRSDDGMWGETERNAFALTARLIERSPALAARLGVGPPDCDRLGQRLADAGVIAGRMAHDFDNVLTGIIGFADLAGPLLPAGSRAAKYVAEIGTIGHRGVGYTRQLHQFSRGGLGTTRPCSAAAVLAAEADTLRPTLAAGAELTVTATDDLQAVGMDAGALAVALGHLLRNAVEATPAGGRVGAAARLANLTPAEARSFFGAARPGPHVEVVISDSGPGLRPDARARLFADPFFTTKVRHRGLGLATVYRVLAAHRGGVRVEPADGGTGTEARVVIPLAAAPPPDPPPPATVPTGG